MAKKTEKAEKKADAKVVEEKVEEKVVEAPKAKKTEAKTPLNPCPSPLDYGTPTEEYIKLAFGFYKCREPTDEEIKHFQQKLNSEGQPRLIMTKLADA